MIRSPNSLQGRDVGMVAGKVIKKKQEEEGDWNIGGQVVNREKQQVCLSLAPHGWSEALRSLG